MYDIDWCLKSIKFLNIKLSQQYFIYDIYDMQLSYWTQNKHSPLSAITVCFINISLSFVTFWYTYKRNSLFESFALYWNIHNSLKIFSHENNERRNCEKEKLHKDHNSIHWDIIISSITVLDCTRNLPTSSNTWNMW